MNGMFDFCSVNDHGNQIVDCKNIDQKLDHLTASLGGRFSIISSSPHQISNFASERSSSRQPSSHHDGQRPKQNFAVSSKVPWSQVRRFSYIYHIRFEQSFGDSEVEFQPWLS